MENGCPNLTAGKELILQGFLCSKSMQTILFTVFLIIYLLTIMENGIIVIIVRGSSLVESPMYLFISYLSCLEILYITVIVPKLLENTVSACKTISLPACITQLHLFFFVACTECLLLAAMAYDRFLAISHPLHYTLMMTTSRCSVMTAGCLLGGFLAATFPIIVIVQLDFCGPNVIDHFFCDISPLLNLSCTDVSIVEMIDFVAACITLLGPILVITVSYAYIIAAVLKIPSVAGRKKAFSTCGSHLIVVTVFYGTAIFTYARPRAMGSFDMKKLVSVMYTIVTPVTNPLIYTLRNKEFKDVLRSTINRAPLSGIISEKH